uniref:Uncharacterized protein n=1 Tax=Panagrolaimus sp. JU765 TaxID=591449 RepID=A0AC34Q4Y1_9BILA
MDRNGHRLWYNLIDNRLTIHDDESERIYHQEIIKFRKDKEKGPRTKPKRRTKISKNSMNSNSNSISNTSSKSTSTKDDEKKKKKKRKLLVEYQPNYGTRTEDTQGTEEPQNSVKNGKNDNEKISGIEVKAGSSSEKTGRNENVDKSAEKCGPKEGKSMLKTDSGEIADPKISSDDENDGKKLEKSNTNDDLKDINL